MRLKGILTAIAALAGAQLGFAAAGVTVLANGPVHEAFVSPTPADIVIEASSEQPPAPIEEKRPTSRDASLVWISGYWTWDDGEDDYVWVSGTLRRPPPEHHWIPGEWEETDEGWVWLKGFWSAVLEGDLEYIEERPPEPLAESMEDPKGEEYFWMPGYWEYDEDEEEYDWLEGSWQKLDPNWVLTPAHYSWRPEGYLFHPAVWDWPVEERGVAYANIAIDPSDREEVVYEPSDELEPVDVVRRLVLYYPNYLCFFNHHYYYHPRFWAQFWGTPPWWRWSGWWSLSWSKQWALWWWYTHPGYPNPRWLDARVAAKIPPPRARLLRRARVLHAPAIVTPRGVVPAKRIYEAMSKVEGRRGRRRPILPADRRMRADIFERAEPPASDEGRRVRPTGRRAIGGGGSEERVPLPVDARARERRRGRTAREPARPRGFEGRPGRAREVRPARRDRVRPVQEVRVPEPRPRPQPEAERPAPPPPERTRPAPRPSSPPPPSRPRPDRPPRPPGTGRNRQPLPPLRPQQPAEPSPSVERPARPPVEPSSRRQPSRTAPAQPRPRAREAQPQRAMPQSDGEAAPRRATRRAAPSPARDTPQATPGSRGGRMQRQEGRGARPGRRRAGGQSRTRR